MGSHMPGGGGPLMDREDLVWERSELLAALKL